MGRYFSNKLKNGYTIMKNFTQTSAANNNPLRPLLLSLAATLVSGGLWTTSALAQDGHFSLTLSETLPERAVSRSGITSKRALS
jgi:hypothetical protein